MDRRYIAVAGNAFAVALLLVALFGSPPYSFFQAMRPVVFVASFYAAYLALVATPWATPLAIGLAVVAFVHMFERMHREQWVNWNWAAIGLLVAASAVILFKRDRVA